MALQSAILSRVTASEQHNSGRFFYVSFVSVQFGSCLARGYGAALACGWYAAVVLVPVALLMLASCGADNGAASGGGTGSGGTAGTTDASGSGAEATADTATDELVIYTYDAFPEGLEELIATHLGDEYGVSVTMERLQDTGGLFNEVMLTRGEGAADLVIGLDNTYIGRALEEDLFQAYEPAELDAVRSDLCCLTAQIG